MALSQFFYPESANGPLSNPFYITHILNKPQKTNLSLVSAIHLSTSTFGLKYTWNLKSDFLMEVANWENKPKLVLVGIL